jgi:hypothetical protein
MYNYRIKILQGLISMSQNRLKSLIKMYEKPKVEKSNTVPAFKTYGFSSDALFCEWCLDNGIVIGNTISFSTQELIKKTMYDQKFQNTLNTSKLKKRKFHILLEDLYESGSTPSNGDKFFDMLSTFSYFKNDEQKNYLMELSQLLVRKQDIFDFNGVIWKGYEKQGFHLLFAKIILLKDYWVRDLKDWNPKSKNSLKVVISLIEHLFVRYKVPYTFYSLWFRDINNSFQVTKPIVSNLDYDIDENCLLFIRIAQGKPLKKAFCLYNKNVGAKPKFSEMTKGEYHTLASDKNTIDNIDLAIRKIILGRYSENIYVIRAVLNSRFAKASVLNDPFLFEYVRYISNEIMFDNNMVMPLFDYILHLKNVYRNEDKKFLLKGRNVVALMDGMNAWHRSLGKETKYPSWEGSGIPKFTLVKENKENPFKNITYNIQELTTGKDLTNEGRSLGHCVGSYAKSCFEGRMHIFSLERVEFGVTKKIITIEITKNLSIVQVRGKHNRSATTAEKNIIAKWCTKIGGSYRAR